MKKILFYLYIFFLSHLTTKAQNSFKEYYNVEGEITKKEKANYYEEGKKDKNGFKTGKVKTFYISGELKESGNYKKGLRTGKFKSYYENGKLKTLGNYDRGSKTGFWQQWHTNGQLKEEGNYLEINNNDINYYTDKEYQIKNYWNKEGKQQVISGNGKAKKYYGSGELESEGAYLEGKKNGEWVGYRENKVLYKENYKKGEFVNGINYKNGNEVTYDVFQKSAQPTGGYKAFYKFINQNMTYPRDAKRNGKQGKVYILFVIDKDGSIKDEKVLRGFYDSCDQEALRVIKIAPAWENGSERGLPVKQRIVIPVSFKLG